jgi:hypothetical protein
VRPGVWLVLLLPLAWPLRGTWRENVSRPFVREELRPVLDVVRAERRPGDAIWVGIGARFAFRFYEPRPDPLVVYPLTVTDIDLVRTSLAATAALGAGRVWAIFGHGFAIEEPKVHRALGRLRIARRVAGDGAVALLLVAP